MILTALSFLARLGALAASIIVLGLYAKFLTNVGWNKDLLNYVEVVAATSTLAALIPPYPNFLYELFWGLAWALAAIFALIVQFFESDCYGFRTDGDLGCATYKAATAFAFLGAFAWLGSAFFGGLNILAVIFDVRQFANRPLYIGGADDVQEGKGKEVEIGNTKSYSISIGARDVTDGEEEVLPRRRRKKVKGFGNTHVAHYFVCYGLLGVVLLAAGIPLLLIYAAPAFAEYLLDRTPIPENVEVTLMNPTNDSISFSVLSRVRVPDAMSVTLSPMQVEFFLPDTVPDIIPLATVDLPELSFKANDEIALRDQTLRLGNLVEFARLVEDVAYQPQFTVAGKARTKVSVGPFKTWVNIFKAVSLDGFNNFPQIDIQKFGIKAADEDGYNVFGELIVQNPSPGTVTLGDVTLVPMIEDIVLGEALVRVNNIVPGNNTFFVKGKLNVASVEGNITRIMALEAPYLKKELIMASATGKSVIYKGQHLPYWEKAFQAIHVSATRPVKPLLMSLVDNTVDSLLGFDGEESENDSEDDSEGAADGYLGEVVEALIDQVLSRFKELPDENLEDFTDTLAGLGKLVLRIFKMLNLI